MATTSQVDDLIQAAIAESNSYFMTNAVLKNAVRNYNIPKKTVEVPIWGSATVYDVTEGTALSSFGGLSTSKATITCSQKATRELITDIADMQSAEALGVALGKQFGAAFTAKMNQDIWALFDGFSNTLGDSTSAITLDNIQAARSLLVQANAPGPYYLAVTPHVLEDLVMAIADTTNSGYILANQVLQTGMVGEVFGCKVLVVSDLVAGTSAGQADAAAAKCGLFSPEAIGFNTMYNTKIEAERSVDYIGTKLVAHVCYGVAELKDSFGVELNVLNKPA